MYDAPRMNTFSLSMLLFGLVFLAACAKEPPPISVGEFMENPRLLEATMVRCGQNRSQMKYEVECVNARDAVNRLEAREKKAKREELEAMSERKRQALRRTQQAAAEARRRALDRENAEFLGVAEGQAGTEFADEVGVATDPKAVAEGNAPGVEISPPEPENVENRDLQFEQETTGGSDIESIREELKRRQDDPQ